MSLSIGGLAVAAARVWTAASELRERLVALTEAAEATCVACMKMRLQSSHKHTILDAHAGNGQRAGIQGRRNMVRSIPCVFSSSKRVFRNPTCKTTD